MTTAKAVKREDEFYPHSETMAAMPRGLWQIGMVVKLATHRANAERGDTEAESRLCNRVGQLRRWLKFDDMTENLRDELRESVAYLRRVGRIVNFKSEDPRAWISTRSGHHRW